MKKQPAQKYHEEEFYGITKQAIEEYFKDKRYTVDFEITGRRGTPRIPEKFLRDDFLKDLLKKYVKLPTPDIMGLIRNNIKQEKLVIVEFKMSPRFDDIFQVKKYDELFKSDYTYLISREPISDRSVKVLDYMKNRPELVYTKCGKSFVVIKFLHRTTEGSITLAQLGSHIGILPDYVDL